MRQLVDLVTGRLEWLRIEPPGEDAIELRCGSQSAEFAHQVKRGVSTGGHWTIAALGEVLDGFGLLLGDESKLRCAFISTHAAPELQELSERARESRDVTEYRKRFLASNRLRAAWDALRTRWRTDAANTWRRLRRITASAIGEDAVRDTTDALLQLLFDAAPETTRAILTDLALESVHHVLRAQDVVERLRRHAINRITKSEAKLIAPKLSAPPAAGVRREAELQRIAGALASGKSTILLGGISGIGKTTVAAQFAARWAGPVCWLDAGLVTTGVEALAAIGEFTAGVAADDSILKAMADAESRLIAIGRLAGKVFSSHRCLLVWDGVDDERQKQLRPVIDAIATTLGSGGAQVMTAQEIPKSGRVANSASVWVNRLPREAVAHLLTDAFPNARTSEIEAADEVTHGHPYLVQLLIDASDLIDLNVALQAVRAEPGAAPLVTAMTTNLGHNHRRILGTLAWLDVPFAMPHLQRLGGSTHELQELAARHLIVRSGSESYRVHDLVAQLLRSTASSQGRIEGHERAALLLRSIDEPSWLEMRATLRHARAAALQDVAREAGTMLLNFAMAKGLWGLAREAAETLTRDSTDFFPHFVLAKSYRMTRDLAKAVSHLEIAERHAPGLSERETARFDRASVLCDLGRRDEADALYTQALESDSASMRSAAKLALALSASARGERDVAMCLLDEALAIATNINATRQIAEIHHAIGRVLIDEQNWKQAREHLAKAHALRLSLGDAPEAFDVIGLFHLFDSILEVEHALQNREGARNAAHGLWRLALAAGSVPWETKAAQAMCLADPNVDDLEVREAITRLHSMATDRQLSDANLVLVLRSLIISEWSLGHYEESTEGMLELLALANERHIRVPMFAYAAPKTVNAQNEVVFEMPLGYGLFVPPRAGPEFVYDVVSRVLERRPELIQHAKMVVGELTAPKTKKPVRPFRRKAVKQKKRN